MTVFKRHPVDNPKITYPFGAGGTAWGSNRHLGVDYGGVTGQPIYAPADGTVVYAGSATHPVGNRWEQIPGSTNNGNHVIIQHSAPHQATATLYAHLSGVAVKAGQFVRAGTVIGFMGNTGYSFGTHLHWEMFIDYAEGLYPAGTFYGRVDPLKYFAVATTVPVTPGAGGGSSTQEEGLAKEDADRVIRHMNALMVNQWHNGDGVMHPGGLRVIEENQRRIGKVPQRTAWDVMVRRGGKDVPWIQDTADATTALARVEAQLEVLLALVTKLTEGIEGFSEAEMQSLMDGAAERAAKKVAEARIEDKVEIIFRDPEPIEEVPATDAPAVNVKE